MFHLWSIFWYQDETVIYVFSFSAKFMHGWKLIYFHHFIEFVEFNNIRILLCYWQWIPYCSISYVSFKLPDSGLKIKLVKIEWMNHCIVIVIHQPPISTGLIFFKQRALSRSNVLTCLRSLVCFAQPLMLVTTLTKWPGRFWVWRGGQ